MVKFVLIIRPYLYLSDIQMITYKIKKANYQELKFFTFPANTANLEKSRAGKSLNKETQVRQDV